MFATVERRKGVVEGGPPKPALHRWSRGVDREVVGNVPVEAPDLERTHLLTIESPPLPDVVAIRWLQQSSADRCGKHAHARSATRRRHLEVKIQLDRLERRPRLQLPELGWGERLIEHGYPSEIGRSTAAHANQAATYLTRSVNYVS
jgi:hypothetical protein